MTIDSDADVRNRGTVSITGANGSTGILANTNLTGDIINSGTITIDENYTAGDSDDDGDADGLFAKGSNRYAIHVLGGGSFTGTINNSGNIIVEGNESAGIAIDSVLDGSLTNRGDVSILGNDSVAIRTSDVTGNFTVGSGSNIAAAGRNSVGVLVGGDVGGAFVLQGSVVSTGYRYTAAPADASSLDSDDLLQGGPAVVVAGNVAGGILLDAKPSNKSTTDDDEDDDGIPDANETTASITSYGSAPALKIGSSSQDIAIGAVGDGPYGLVIEGSVSGFGVYEGVDATALSIGGLGHSVDLAAGIDVSGSVRASAVEANATAVRIGAGTSSPVIRVSGTVSPAGGGSSSAQALVIDSGATVNSIINRGSIRAASDEKGSAAAIVDKSGTVSLVENRGSIGATLGDETTTPATAIDLRANTIGVTLRQVAAASNKPAPQITGDIFLGSGTDAVQILAGSVTGDIDFGGGSDALTVNGTYRGRLLDTAGLAVNVGSKAVLDVRNEGTVNLGSLTTGSNATLGVTIGGSGHTLYNVAGEANLGSGTQIAVTIDKVGSAEGSYTIIDAGSLTGADNLSSTIASVPFLFESSLSAAPAAGEVTLNVKVKEAAELGLNASETAIFDGALGAVDADKSIAAVFLTAADADTVKDTLQQLMPEHAGGTFETVSRGSRLAGEMLGDPRPLSENASGMWVQQFGWSTDKPIGTTTDFKVSGWGATGGYERRLGALGSVGVSAAYVAGRDSNGENELVSNHFEGGVYWRGGTGPLRAFARAGAGTVSFEGTRYFNDQIGDEIVSRSAEGDWKGRVYSALGGASYTVRSGRLSILPSVTVDYTKLTEKAYTETGGGEAFDLTVGRRSSSETAANALLAVGYDLMGTQPEDSWMRLELQGGRRAILNGSLGETEASFGDGDTFSLTPEDRSSGWRGALRLTGGGTALSFGAELGAEQVQGDTAFNGRIGVSLAM